MVSVVITTFNRGILVLNAIESVLRQTYTNYEIIVIDGGSTDDTATRLQPYLGRIQYLTEKDRGVSDGRNKGIKLARGEWIAILDSDDTWLPRKLELQLTTVAEMGTEFGVCFTDSTRVVKPGGSHTFFDQAGFHPTVQSGRLDKPVQCVLAYYPAIHTSSLLIKRSLIEGLNGFDEEMLVMEDTDLLFRLCFKTKFCWVNIPLVDVDGTSPFSTGRLSRPFGEKSDRMIRSEAHMYNKWLQLLEHQGDMELRQRIRDSLKFFYYSWLITMLKRFRWSDAIPLAKQIMHMGDNYYTICAVLFTRGMKRTLRQTL
jgi:glycosyltransferase involved in cell wall biosynthesis